jgi:hypothetical protein
VVERHLVLARVQVLVLAVRGARVRAAEQDAAVEWVEGVERVEGVEPPRARRRPSSGVERHLVRASVGERVEVIERSELRAELPRGVAGLGLDEREEHGPSLDEQHRKQRSAGGFACASPCT